jgi:large repetitive protein
MGGPLVPDSLNDLVPAGSDLDRYADLLSLLDATGATHQQVDTPTPHKTWQGSLSASTLTSLTFDPLVGGFGHTDSGGGGRPLTLGNPPDTYLEFPNPSIAWTLSVDYTDTTYVTKAGPFDLRMTFPASVLHLAALHGAKLDAQGLLVPDEAHPTVVFHLPSLTVKVARGSTGSAGASLLSAGAGAGGGGPDTYDFCRMDPPYALVGPGAVFGFAFRSAVLDLSDVATPGTPPPGVGADWHGLWLPEARIFVSPHGMEDFAVDGGVRDLYVGVGSSSGVSGTFDLEVVNRGTAPAVSLRVVDGQGRSFAVDGSGNVQAPEHCAVIVDATGGIAPYTYSVTASDSTASATDRLDLTVPATGTLTVTATVTDGGSHPTTFTAHVRRTTGSGGNTPGASTVTPATTSSGTAQVHVDAQTGTGVTVSLQPSPGDGTTVWTWNGGSHTGATATIPVAAGPAVGVTAVWTPAGGQQTKTCYFRDDHPTGRPGVANDSETSATPAVDPTSTASWQPPGGAFALGEDVVPHGVHVTVTGYASYDGDPSQRAIDYNAALSGRRQAVLTQLLARVRSDLVVDQGTANGFTDSHAAGGDRRPWWKATVTYTPPGPVTVTGTLTRPASPPPTDPHTSDPVPPKPHRPDWFRRLGARVTLVQSTFVRCEVYCEFDMQTATESKLHGSGQYIDPMDGVTDADIKVIVDDTTKSWRVEASLKAHEADRDGLAQAKRPDGNGSHPVLDTLGAYAALTPVLALAAPASPTDSDYVGLALGAAAIGAFSSILKAKTVTLRGGVIDVSDRDGRTEVVLMLDLETKLGLDAGIISVSLDKPITVRYKAVGLSFAWGGSDPFVLRPVFDPNKGYTLDIPQGAVVADPPLGDLLQVLGTRVSRDNPTYIEVEVGLDADLGIVHIDKARVRMRLDSPEVPQLTALGAGVDVPGVMHGSGYLAVNPGDISGSLDLALDTLQVRIMASLKVVTDPVTGVFVGLEVDFPVPIALGTSGLGIFGFLGAVGVNMHRVENSSAAVPALDWLVNTEHGNPIDPTGWDGQAGSFALALGALIGTMDGGFIVHLKGALLLELPGPRLLLMMRADLLSLPPALGDNGAQATFLAVIELSPDGLTIALVAEYDIVELLHIKVPLAAGFPFTNPENWYVDLGTWNDPITVQVFTALSGSGYLMLHGNGITLPNPPLPDVPTGGFTIAAGAHLSFVWGSESIGLYLKVAGGFDVIVSFSPFALGGKIVLSGELRLFIISIGASAELDVHAGKQELPDHTIVSHTYAHGQICGEVDFFFFSVSGCIDFTLGDTDPPPPLPLPLVSGVSLVSRSPALVEGGGTDRAIDGKIGDATDSGAGPSVPLDSIPVIHFDVTPDLEGGFGVAMDPGAATLVGTTGGTANPWVQRGRRWWRYSVTSVTLHGGLSAGGRPAVWWVRSATGDRMLGASLALLDWLPDATPRVVPYGEQLTTDVHERWGTVCDDAAKPAPVLWTFHTSPLGPSAGGWTLSGVAWPDDPGTLRSSPPPLGLRVVERWRCGDTDADRRRGILAARVVGGQVACQDEPAPHLAILTEMGPAAYVAPIAMVTELATAGTALTDVHAALVSRQAMPAAAGAIGAIAAKGCPGRILRAPQGDGKDPVQAGDPAATDVVVAAWKARGFEPGELVDAIEISAVGGLSEIRVLMLVPERLLQDGVVARFLDAEGNELGRRPVTGTDLLGNVGTPARWTDTTGPWRDPVARAMLIGNQIAPSEHEGQTWVLLQTDVPKDCVTVELGIDPRYDRPAGKGPRVVPFYLAAVEGLGVAEEQRWSYDETTQTSNAQALSTALTAEPDDYALLIPGTAYKVDVTWNAHVMDQDAQPQITDIGTPAAGDPTTQSFFFTGDGADRVPDRLDPWVLATTPGPDERGVFCDDPVRITFATQNVARLFAEYGDTLQLVLRAASGRHPNPDGTVTTGSPPVPVLLDPTVLGLGGLRIATPWEEAAAQLAERLPCANISGSRDEHVAVEIAFPLDERTDYLVDIERVGPDGTVRVFRRGFSTGQFRSLAAYAGFLASARLDHRAVPSPAALTTLPDRPSGQALDEAFRAAGLPTPEVPRFPLVTVLWNTDPVPQPVAVVLDSADPLWRSRPVPTEVTGPIDPLDPTHHWWASVDTDWLAVATSGSVSVTRVVRGAGDQRAVILLGPGARGNELVLTLHQAADPLSGQAAIDVECGRATFDHAPWEDLEP